MTARPQRCSARSLSSYRYTRVTGSISLVNSVVTAALPSGAAPASSARQRPERVTKTKEWQSDAKGKRSTGSDRWPDAPLLRGWERSLRRGWQGQGGPPRVGEERTGHEERLCANIGLD